MPAPRQSDDPETLVELFKLYRALLFVLVLLTTISLTGFLMGARLTEDVTDLNWAFFLLLLAGSKPAVPIVLGALTAWAGLACVLLHRGRSHRSKVSAAIAAGGTVALAGVLVGFLSYFYYDVFAHGPLSAPLYEFYTLDANLETLIHLVDPGVEVESKLARETGMARGAMVMVYALTVALPLFALTFIVQACLALLRLPAMPDRPRTIVPGLTVQTPTLADLEALYGVVSAYYEAQQPAATKWQINEAWRELGLKTSLKNVRMFKLRKAVIGFYHVDPRKRTLPQFLLAPRFLKQGYGAFMYQDLQKTAAKYWIGMETTPATDAGRKFFQDRGWVELSGNRLRAPKR